MVAMVTWWQILRVELLAIAKISSTDIYFLLFVYQEWITENVTTDFQDHYVIDLEEAADNR